LPCRNAQAPARGNLNDTGLLSYGGDLTSFLASLIVK
jgi:hypothetical protein